MQRKQEQNPELNLAPSMQQGFDTNNFFSKLPIVAALLIPSFFAYFLGIPIYIIVIAFIVIALILLFRKKGDGGGIGKSVLFVIISCIIIFIVIMYGPQIFGPLGQIGGTYAEPLREGTVLGGAKLSTFWSKKVNELQVAADTRIACASGSCPEGDVEGTQTLITLTSPKQASIDSIVTGSKFEITSEIQGLNLKMYGTGPNDKQIIAVECSNNGEKATINPLKVDFADISNEASENQRKKVLHCSATGSEEQINEVNISASFTYTTTGDLPICIIKNDRRNIMLEKWGQYTNDFECNVDPKTISTYNDGPIELGIAVSQIPIPVKGDSSTELMIAIWNKWGAQNGIVQKIEQMDIELPSGFSIPVMEYGENCPFRGSGNKYSIADASLVKPINGVRPFSCELSVPDQAYDATEHIRVTITYSYKIIASGNFVTKDDEKDGDGDTTDPPVVPPEEPPVITPDVAGVIAAARSYVGIQYDPEYAVSGRMNCDTESIIAGITPEYLSCACFVSLAYKDAGLINNLYEAKEDKLFTFSTSASGLCSELEQYKEITDKSQLQAGDILCIDVLSVLRPGIYNHVGLVTGNSGGIVSFIDSGGGWRDDIWAVHEWSDIEYMSGPAAWYAYRPGAH